MPCIRPCCCFTIVKLAVFQSHFKSILSSPLGDHQSPYARPQEQNERVQLVMWLLQHKLLQQLHTYVYLLLPDLVDPPVAAHDVGMGSDCSDRLGMTNGPEQALALSPPEMNGTASDASSNDSSMGAAGGGTPTGASNAATSTTLASTNGEEASKARGKTQETLLSELTVMERQAVFRLDAANNSDDLKLFAKLLRYFRGKQHLEEIMYYENISRSQILIILDKFRDVLVTSLHPDPVTSVFLD